MTWLSGDMEPDPHKRPPVEDKWLWAVLVLYLCIIIALSLFAWGDI